MTVLKGGGGKATNEAKPEPIPHAQFEGRKKNKARLGG